MGSIYLGGARVGDRMGLPRRKSKGDCWLNGFRIGLDNNSNSETLTAPFQDDRKMDR